MAAGEIQPAKVKDDTLLPPLSLSSPPPSPSGMLLRVPGTRAYCSVIIRCAEKVISCNHHIPSLIQIPGELALFCSVFVYGLCIFCLKLFALPLLLLCKFHTFFSIEAVRYKM